jgi:outer membrane protein assembly factor BamB
MQRSALLGLITMLAGCSSQTAPGADPHDAWSVTLDQRWVDPYPAVAGGNFICFAYDADWPRDDDHRQGAGVLTAIDAASGRVIWKQPIELRRQDASVYNRALSRGLILIGERSVFYRGADGAVHVLDAASGKEKWTRQKAGNLLGVQAGILVMSDDVFRIELRDANTGALRAAQGASRADGENDAQVLFDDDRLYVLGGNTTAVSLSTGKEVWSVKTTLKPGRVMDGLLIGEKTYKTETVALHTSDGAVAWTAEGSVSGSHHHVLVLERMHVGPVYRAHKIDVSTGRELSEESQEDFKRDFQFHEDLTVAGVAFTAPYVNHYGETYQRLHDYSKESQTKDEWIEARKPGTGQLYWQTPKLWGWVSDLASSGDMVIRAETFFPGGHARVRALRAVQ